MGLWWVLRVHIILAIPLTPANLCNMLPGQVAWHFAFILLGLVALGHRDGSFCLESPETKAALLHRLHSAPSASLLLSLSFPVRAECWKAQVAWTPVSAQRRRAGHVGTAIPGSEPCAKCPIVTVRRGRGRSPDGEGSEPHGELEVQELLCMTPNAHDRIQCNDIYSKVPDASVLARGDLCDHRPIFSSKLTSSEKKVAGAVNQRSNQSRRSVLEYEAANRTLARIWMFCFCFVYFHFCVSLFPWFVIPSIGHFHIIA